MSNTLLELKIVPVKDNTLEQKIKARLDDLTKPPGSLGRLEEFVTKYCLIRGSDDAHIDTMELYTFAGDHGITSEGVCPFPKEVTCQMVMNMLSGGAAISVLCKHAGIKSNVVDIGVDGDFIEHPLLLKRKVKRGTDNFAKGSAMSISESYSALEAGSKIAEDSTADIFGIGEMGIGNSSSASALYALLLDIDPIKTVGAGTGSSGAMLDKKRKVISDAVAFHAADWDRSAEQALARVGGLEIAGMTGMILGAAQTRRPVVVDGFIASAAALVAVKMCEDVKDYLFFAHASAESFHKSFLDMLSIEPILNLDMRLGEGTGAVLGMQIISQAMNCYHEMATFSQAKVSNRD